MNLSKYVNDNKLKFTPDEIKQLFQDKDKNRNKIISSQLPLALNIADSFNKTTGIDIDYLFSYALEGLLNALDTFSPDDKSNSTFTTYSKTCITNSIIYSTRYNKMNIINKPYQNVKNEPVPIAYTFTSLLRNYNEDDEFGIENNISDDSRPYSDNEDKLESEIRKQLKPKVADVVILYLGINQDKALTFKEIGKLKDKSSQAVHLSYHTGLSKLKENERFKKYLNNLR